MPYVNCKEAVVWQCESDGPLPEGYIECYNDGKGRNGCLVLGCTTCGCEPFFSSKDLGFVETKSK